MRLQYIPNVITVLRILLIVPIAVQLLERDYQSSLILMGVAGVSDAVDGALARKFRWTSQFGAAMDPLADKLLVGVLFVVLTVQGHLPVWVVVIAVGRDAIIMTGAATYRWLFERIEFQPTFLSKANTAVQIATLIFLLVGLAGFPRVSAVAWEVVNPWCFYVLAVLGVCSGIDYVITWGRRAHQMAGARRLAADVHRPPADT